MNKWLRTRFGAQPKGEGYMKKGEKRFEVLMAESPGMTKEVSILRDKETGVQYLFFFAGYAGGLTPLLGADGKPVIDNTPVE